MDNDKYGLHDVLYGVQGWDAIMATDMQIINDQMPTRIIGTLGETVVAYQALYQKAADSKWWKAKADGAKQPCQGLAVEGGDADDEIRIHRMGEITDVSWAWGTIGAPIYLDASTAGALTQTAPPDNVQIIGYAKSATTMIVILGVLNVGIQKFSQGGTIYKSDGIVDAANIIIWEAPFACTVTNVKGYRVGGTGATVNARKNGADDHLAGALSLTNPDVWMDGGVVQNTAYALGDKLEIMLVSVAGSPTQIAIKVDFKRP